ncbi:hypothetical protein HMPREF0973_00048 [Prevotella veroralis F0319]|uniref:Uncharacterized protein n=1 Tax=Prevotella veroralis F0319 TaxID=649761 RepID=C9MKC9_9BACT|nr:hypothetical protein HMPREF0973_00048 [Prevotella veroralis F0319]
MLERTDEGVCPYFVVIYCTEQITSLLVNQSTRQLYLIIILNYELCILNCSKSLSLIEEPASK